jgi:hypothetical protein
MKVLMRVVLLALLAALSALRLWLATLGLAQLIGVEWALALALGLLLMGIVLPLQIAIFCGALLVWHWPPLLALMVAAPRLLLMLPGLISTFLAGRRHPRPRWSSVKPL